MKEFCQSCAGSTRPLAFLREKLKVQDYVQLLNCFPEIRKPLSNDVVDDTGLLDVDSHDIMIYFDDPENSVSAKSSQESSLESGQDFSSSLSSIESQSFLTQPSASEDSFHTPQAGKSRVKINTKVSAIGEVDSEHDSVDHDEVAQSSECTAIGQKPCKTWKSHIVQRVLTVSVAVASAFVISRLSSLN